MRRCNLLATTSMVLFTVGTACGQKPTASTRQPIPALPSTSQNNLPGGFTAVTQLRAMPDTIPFAVNNPGGSIAGGSVATITWNISQGKNGRTWTLMAGATSSTFRDCITVPVSAINLKCVSASASGDGQTSAGCNLTNFVTLPNTLPGLSLASGNEGNATSHSYTVVLSYQLTDSWRYIANTCPLNVSYTVVAQ
jgi:hypothetical protein